MVLPLLAVVLTAAGRLVISQLGKTALRSGATVLSRHGTKEAAVEALNKVKGAAVRAASPKAKLVRENPRTPKVFMKGVGKAGADAEVPISAFQTSVQNMMGRATAAGTGVGRIQVGAIGAAGIGASVLLKKLKSARDKNNLTSEELATLRRQYLTAVETKFRSANPNKSSAAVKKHLATSRQEFADFMKGDTSSLSFRAGGLKKRTSNKKRTK